MGQQNGTQRFLVVASSLHLVEGGLLHTIRSDSTQAPRQRPKLLVDVAAEAGVDERSPFGCFTWAPAMEKSRRSNNEPPRYPKAVTRWFTPVTTEKTARFCGGVAEGCGPV